MTERSREDLLAQLAADPRSLQGQAESQFLEVKSQPHLKPNNRTEDSHRFELAKDVTAMANADGGLLIWGFTEERNSENLTSFVGRPSPIAHDIIDEGQIHKTLQEWIHPYSGLDYELIRHEVPPGWIWVINIRPQRPIDKPFLVIREWRDSSKRSPTRGHFTMYIRRGTSNMVISPEEMYRWIHRGYHDQPSLSVPATDVAASNSTPLREQADDALSAEIIALSIEAGTLIFYLQFAATTYSLPRIRNFFGMAPGSIQARFSNFDTIRSEGFSAFNPYAIVERGPRNTLRKGIESIGSAQVSPSGLATFVCGERTLTWASDKYGRGKRVINAVALPEFILEAARFVALELADEIQQETSTPAIVQWRLGFQGLDTQTYLPNGMPSSTTKLHPSDDFETEFREAKELEPESLAYPPLEEVYFRFGYSPEDIPFTANGHIDANAIRRL